MKQIKKMLKNQKKLVIKMFKPKQKKKKKWYQLPQLKQNKK